MKPAFAALSAVLFWPTVLLAWGGDGHQIVCLIAEDRLTPAAKAAVHDLLGKDVNISDAEVASWADKVRRERPATGPWHFVDIPLDAKGFDEKRDGRHGNNVMDKVSDFRAVLKDRKASKQDRAEALKFLVHFVGDLHQPLHCAEPNGDKRRERPAGVLPGPGEGGELARGVGLRYILLDRKGRARVADYADRLNATDHRGTGGGVGEGDAGGLGERVARGRGRERVRGGSGGRAAAEAGSEVRGKSGSGHGPAATAGGGEAGGGPERGVAVRAATLRSECGGV